MNDMNLMDELLKIPADATAATVQGIEMLLIDENKAGALLESDPNDNTIHECLLSNGRFLFQSDNANLVAPGLPCMDCPMPQDMESATRLILELRKVVSESLPKIVFYEEFIENRDWFKSTRIADELGISPRQLHQFLAEEGICKYEKRQWVVFPSCRAWQCDVPYTWENSRGKVYTFGSTKRWTQAGRECIIELWRKRNPEYCPPGA